MFQEVDILIHWQLRATTGGGGCLAVRRMSTQSAYLASTLSTTRSGVTDNNIIILIFMFDDWRPYQVFLVLWWWFLLLLLIGLVRLLYRAIQCRLSSQYDEYNDGKDFIKRGLHLTLQVGVVTIPPAHDETLSELQEVNQGWAHQGLCQSRKTWRLVKLLLLLQTCKLSSPGLFSTRWAKTSTDLSSWTFSAKSVSDTSTKLRSRTKKTMQVEGFGLPSCLLWNVCRQLTCSRMCQRSFNGWTVEIQPPLTMLSSSFSTGDNLMSMLLKPSYNAQESKEVCIDGLTLVC